MERFVAFVLSNFSTIVIFSSLGWMFLRAYQVLSKPSDDLINLLGIEVPSAPALSLHGIRADGVILNWKAPDLQKSSSIKYCLFVNGISVGELSPLETSIAITDLKPDTNYIIRVIATNSMNFEAKSEPIHVQTRDASSQDFFRKRDSHDESAEETSKEPTVPVVGPYKLPGDMNVSIPTAPVMTREHSGSISQQRKSTGGRRVSAPIPHGNQHSVPDDSDDGETVRELTAKLDKLNQEIEATKVDLSKEDDEYQGQLTSLNGMKLNLKQAVADKDNASKSLKKQVADLSSQNTIAQGKRQAAERRLQSKREDREKLQDDVKKWDEEILAFRTETAQFEDKKVIMRKEADEELERVRQQLAEETATNKVLEDALKRSRNEIKELTSERDRLGQGDSEHGQGVDSFTSGGDDWPQRLQAMQYAYNQSFQNLEQARNFAHQAHLKLEEWEQRRAAQPHLFMSAPIIDIAPGRRNSNRRSRTLSLRNSEISPSVAGFDMSSAPPYSTAMSSISPAFASASPFFNIMAKGAPMVHDHMLGMSPMEIEQLTAGAPTSPSVAGALLPAGLLHDDESKLGSLDSGSSKSSPMAANALPGLGAPQTLEHAHRDPTSPISNTSRSPSVFASPRESSTHLPFNFPADSLFDTDRRSIRSATSSFRNFGPPPNPGTRFAQLFNFNRQRGKTSSDEGPALGSLKSAESQSFPRQDLTEAGVAASRRRGSHSGGTWRDQLQNPFSRSSANKEQSDAPAPRKRFGMFGTKSVDTPDSPRPGSTASSENNQLPKPSADSSSRFGWGVPGDQFGPRHSPLGADWSMAQNSWSRHPSRRPSFQYGTGPPPGFLDDSFNDTDADLAPRRRSPKLAPIGTRPASQISSNSLEKPKLNPAAPSFKIPLFNREKKEKGEKAEKSEKAEKGKSKKESPKEKEKTRDASPAPLAEPLSPHPPSSHGTSDISPPDPRASRDTPSIYTADTSSEPRTSLERTPSRASEATPKESFMQKLSRKSSASMFNFPSFGGSKEKGGRFSAKKAQAYQSSSVASLSASGELATTAHDETDEEGAGRSMTITPGSAADLKLLTTASNAEHGGSSLSGSPMIGPTPTKDEKKFSFRRSLTGRRKGDRAPSLHESEAGASEIGDTIEEGENEVA